MYAVFYMFLVFMYFFLFEYKYKASLGKRIFRLRIVGVRHAVAFKTMLLRSFFNVFLFPIVILTGIFYPKHLIDYTLGTAVVKKNISK